MIQISSHKIIRPLSAKDRRYLSAPPMTVLLDLRLPISSHTLYQGIQRIVEQFPEFSSTIVEKGSELCLQSRPNHFYFAVEQLKIPGPSALPWDQGVSFQQLKPYINEFIPKLDHPLLGVKLMNYDGGSSIAVSLSHVIGDAETFKLLFANLFKNIAAPPNSKSQPQESLPENSCLPGMIRSGSINRIIIGLEEITKIQSDFNRSSSFRCTKNDVLVAILLEKLQQSKVDLNERFSFRIPVSLRQKQACSQSIGNCYSSALFEKLLSELHQMTLSEKITMIHDVVRSHTKVAKHSHSAQETQHEYTKQAPQSSNREVIFSNLGDVSILLKKLPDGVMRSIMSLSSDPWAFVIQRTINGYEITQQICKERSEV